MSTIDMNVTTGVRTVIPLTQPEIDAGVIAKAAEDIYNLPDNRAGRAIDAADRLLFEVNFDHENRIRVLEAKAPITRAQYRNALIAVYKALP